MQAPRRSYRNRAITDHAFIKRIIIRLHLLDNKHHNLPHVHAKYAEFEASIGIGDGDVLSGELPRKQLRLVQAWIEIHRDELMADWELAVSGETPYKIDPL